jgi:hypothetical protein
MSSLSSVQLNDRAAGDYERYFLELRDDQLIYLNLCDEMPATQALQISGGRRTVFVADFSPELRECLFGAR